VFAADLNNEPHGCASWGDGVLATDWQLGAERLGAVVLEANPKLLVFVEGVERNGLVQPQDNCWWGGHIAAAQKVGGGGARDKGMDRFHSSKLGCY
jgi:endoglucanase